MDTVEELNGTYFYKGISNISAGELFFWIMLDEINDYFGNIGDLLTISLILLGQPILKTRGKPRGATPGTSIASAAGRRWLNIELPRPLPTFTNASIKTLRPMMTRNLGAFVGRTIPVVGWVLLAKDIATITFNVMNKYKKIARGNDKIW
ncbi:STM2901 family protein [Cronobacter turicensis]